MDTLPLGRFVFCPSSLLSLLSLPSFPLSLPSLCLETFDLPSLPPLPSLSFLCLYLSPIFFLSCYFDTTLVNWNPHTLTSHGPAVGGLAFAFLALYCVPFFLFPSLPYLFFLHVYYTKHIFYPFIWSRPCICSLPISSCPYAYTYNFCLCHACLPLGFLGKREEGTSFLMQRHTDGWLGGGGGLDFLLPPVPFPVWPSSTSLFPSFFSSLNAIHGLGGGVGTFSSSSSPLYIWNLTFYFTISFTF